MCLHRIASQEEETQVYLRYVFPEQLHREKSTFSEYLNIRTIGEMSFLEDSIPSESLATIGATTMLTLVAADVRHCPTGSIISGGT
jgi:hypothetical protein